MRAEDNLPGQPPKQEMMKASFSHRSTYYTVRRTSYRTGRYLKERYEITRLLFFNEKMHTKLEISSNYSIVRVILLLKNMWMNQLDKNQII